MATLEIPFAIGEQLWSTGHGMRTEHVTCPECAGTKVLTLIKGNGERVELNCGYCGTGYDRASGVVPVTIYEHQPTPFVPRRVDMSCGEFTYSEASPEANAYSYTYAKNLYRSREECEAACARLNAERTADDERRALLNLQHKRRALSHSASYWTQQAAKLRKDLERVEARVRVLKAPEAA